MYGWQGGRKLALIMRQSRLSGFWVGYPVLSDDMGLIMGMSQTSSGTVPAWLGMYFLPLFAVIPLLA